MITDGREGDELSLGHGEFVGLRDTQRQLGIQGCRGGADVGRNGQRGRREARRVDRSH